MGRPRRFLFEMVQCDDTTNEIKFNYRDNQIQVTNRWGNVLCMSFDDEEEVTLRNCDAEDYYNQFYYNQFNGQIELTTDKGEAKCLDVNTRGKFDQVIIADCKSETHIASSFGMSSSADSLFMEVDGLLGNAIESVGHEWILFSNEFEENVLYAHPSADEELCTSVSKVWTGGAAVASNYIGLRAISCYDFDSSEFTF